MEPADFAKLQSTRGGEIDTELKEFAVSPTREPLAVRAVTIVTPVANMPRACLNSPGKKVGASARDGGAIIDILAI